MTRLDWSKARRPPGWSYEASPYRPATATDYLLGGLGRRPVTPASRPPAAITLTYLASAGANRIAVWCRACRTAEHHRIDGLAADILAAAITELSGAVRCGRCSAPTMVTPFREGPAKHVGPHLP